MVHENVLQGDRYIDQFVDVLFGQLLAIFGNYVARCDRYSDYCCVMSDKYVRCF